jgi:5,10-methylene-tetrahydrofolate dehydrogenase/methenyl tetrahydrofolate cyclohydrolase
MSFQLIREQYIEEQKRYYCLYIKLDEKDVRQTVEKNNQDPMFQGTLNQLEIFNQLKQHLSNEVVRYRSAGRIDVANFIAHSMAGNLNHKKHESINKSMK